MRLVVLAALFAAACAAPPVELAPLEESEPVRNQRVLGIHTLEPAYLSGEMDVVHLAGHETSTARRTTGEALDTLYFDVDLPNGDWGMITVSSESLLDDILPPVGQSRILREPNGARDVNGVICSSSGREAYDDGAHTVIVSQDDLGYTLSVIADGATATAHFQL